MIAQDPPAHAQGIARPSVNLLVAAPDDEAPDGFVMPDLIGMPVVSRAGRTDRRRHQVCTARFVRCAETVGNGERPPGRR